jgi:hypothetical protein
MTLRWTSTDDLDPPLLSAVDVHFSSAADGLERMRSASDDCSDVRAEDPIRDDEEERIMTRGVGCCKSLSLLLDDHRSIMAEAKALQNPGTSSQQQPQAGAQQPAEESKSATGALMILQRHLWRLCPKLPLACGMLASLLLTAASFCAPYMQGRLFDSAVEACQRKEPVDVAFKEEIVPVLLVLGGIYAATWVLECAVGILFAVAAHTALTKLRCAMFANLVQQDIAFYDSHVSGELSSRLINDSGQLQGLVQFVSQDFLQASVRILGALAAMYLTHPILAALATVITPLNWFIIRRAGAVQGLYGIVQNAAIAKANAAAVESLGAMRTVQSYAGEEAEDRRFSSAIHRFRV